MHAVAVCCNPFFAAAACREGALERDVAFGQLQDLAEIKVQTGTFK